MFGIFSVDFVAFFRIPIFASTKFPRNTAYFDIDESTFMCSTTMDCNQKGYAIYNTLNYIDKNPEHLCIPIIETDEPESKT